ncbi:hypothetical protein N8Z93_02950 [Amylibacter sp.]|nr:hypothetical protein [Amylibacter sp.]
MKEHSNMIQAFMGIGLQRFAWAIRKYHIPVSKDTLVLEVGSGCNPFPRSNVIFDVNKDTCERQ